MSRRSRYLLKNTVSFALGKFGTRLISFFLVPLYTYALLTEEYGTVDLISTVCTVVMPILILNISEAVMRFCLDHGADHKKIMSTGLLLLVFATGLGALLTPILYLFPSFSGYMWLIYAYVISMAYSQVFLCYLRGQEKLTAYSIGSILHTASAAGLNILFLVVLHWGIQGYLLAYVLSNVITAVYAAAAGRVDQAVKAFGLDRELSKAMIRFSVVLIPNTFMWWIINSSDRVMVTAFIGAAANGIYAVSYKIPSLLSTVSEVFNQAWLYSAIREKNSADETAYHNAIYHNMVQALVIVTAGVMMVIKPFLGLYVAPEYESAWRYTPYLLIGFLFLSLATFLATSYSMHKDSLGFLLSSIMGAGVNLVLNLLLIPALGVSGAALATCASYVAVFLFRAVHTRKYIHIRILRWKHLLCYGLLIAMGALLFVQGVIGQVLLVVLFLAVLALSREFPEMLVRSIVKKVKNHGK
ncbi:MAG: oligosaccharide flippase family protein [Oscillospiraceae bacterium]|nr:oligosaccharide flippase family protein [Oscillospiraceae bacterium]